MHKFKVGDKVLVHRGDKIYDGTVIANDLIGMLPICVRALVPLAFSPNTETLLRYKADGRATFGGSAEDKKFYIEPAPEQWYQNVYASPRAVAGGWHRTRKDANLAVGATRVGILVALVRDNKVVDVKFEKEV